MLNHMLNDFMLAVVFFIVALGFYIIGGVSYGDRVHREAVKAGAAYWTVDQNGNSQFHWITE